LAVYSSRQYAFLEKLFSGELQKDDAMTVLCTHSTTLFILQELEKIAKDLQKGALRDINPKNLPILCFEYYQTKIEPVLPRGLSFGHMSTFDIAYIQNSSLFTNNSRRQKILSSHKGQIYLNFIKY